MHLRFPTEKISTLVVKSLLRAPILIQEALWVEYLWLVPFGRVMVQRPLVDENDGIF